ncbi:MAG: hypothetical protein V7K62_25800 [Nostoc sp.]
MNSPPSLLDKGAGGNGTKKRYSPCPDWLTGSQPLGWEPILGGLPPPVA